MEIVREYGAGPVRIGNQIPMGEDIYTMLFASCIKYEYLYYYRSIKGKKGDLEDSEEGETEDKADEANAAKDDGPF